MPGHGSRDQTRRDETKRNGTQRSGSSGQGGQTDTKAALLPCTYTRPVVQLCRCETIRDDDDDDDEDDDDDDGIFARGGKRSSEQVPTDATLSVDVPGHDAGGLVWSWLFAGTCLRLHTM